jgi:hypothetical protein
MKTFMSNKSRNIENLMSKMNQHLTVTIVMIPPPTPPTPPQAMKHPRKRRLPQLRKQRTAAAVQKMNLHQVMILRPVMILAAALEILMLLL